MIKPWYKTSFTTMSWNLVQPKNRCTPTSVPKREVHFRQPAVSEIKLVDSDFPPLHKGGPAAPTTGTTNWLKIASEGLPEGDTVLRMSSKTAEEIWAERASEKAARDLAWEERHERKMYAKYGDDWYLCVSNTPEDTPFARRIRREEQEARRLMSASEYDEATFIGDDEDDDEADWSCSWGDMTEA